MKKATVLICLILLLVACAKSDPDQSAIEQAALNAFEESAENGALDYWFPAATYRNVSVEVVRKTDQIAQVKWDFELFVEGEWRHIQTSPDQPFPDCRKNAYGEWRCTLDGDDVFNAKEVNN